MMRPMKLAGSQLLFGEGCLEHIRTLAYKRVTIVLGGSSMHKSGMLDKVKRLFEESGAVVSIIEGVEPDPTFATVLRGAKEMQAAEPDLIVALGGGSVMDAAKTMWIYYENPQLQNLEDVLPPNPFPQLRTKAHFCCIPSTAGTASEGMEILSYKIGGGGWKISWVWLLPEALKVRSIFGKSRRRQ